QLKEEYGAVIKVASYLSEKCKRCRCMSYFGGLLAGCSNSCRPQGYVAVIGETGIVLGFVEQTFQRYNPMGLSSYARHSPLSTEEVKRLAEISNSTETLKKIYEEGFTGGDTNGYAARISKMPSLKDDFKKAGNTVATFLLHLSRVRETYGIKGFPLYKGKTPVLPADLEGMLTPADGSYGEHESTAAPVK
ncbi:MAG: hypothetical protein AABZ06_06450, partial [Bdellovibrionota bacterium]